MDSYCLQQAALCRESGGGSGGERLERVRREREVEGEEEGEWGKTISMVLLNN